VNNPRLSPRTASKEDDGSPFPDSCGDFENFSSVFQQPGMNRQQSNIFVFDHASPACCTSLSPLATVAHHNMTVQHGPIASHDDGPKHLPQANVLKFTKAQAQGEMQARMGSLGIDDEEFDIAPEDSKLIRL
jgi:hypothetical protein